jgi:hypothetical protein
MFFIHVFFSVIMMIKFCKGAFGKQIPAKRRLFQFDWFYSGCQGGFMLLELLMGLLAGACLVSAVVHWYVSYTAMEGHSQRTIRELATLSKCLCMVQSRSSALPRTGNYQAGGSSIEILVIADKNIHQFCWVSGRIRGSGQRVNELMLGVMSDELHATPRV